VEVLRAKCLNPHCKVRSFTIFPRGLEKYSRATQRLKQEAICGLINDNSTTPRISKRFKRVSILQVLNPLLTAGNTKRQR